LILWLSSSLSYPYFSFLSLPDPFATISTFYHLPTFS